MGKNFTKLSADEIKIDSSYQRSLDEGRVVAMAKHLDQSRLGVPVLSVRKDGSFVVLDGQHRLEATRRAGLGDTKILCEVHNGLTPAQEAELFLKLNNGRKAVRVYDKYRARIVAREQVAVDFTAIIESLGLHIGRAPGRSVICAIQAVESVHKRNRNLHSTLSVLKKWGGGDATVFDGEMIRDMSRFMIDHADGIDINYLVTKLTNVDPGHVLRRIKATMDALNGNRRLAANSVLREIYNRRCTKVKLQPVEMMAAA